MGNDFTAANRPTNCFINSRPAWRLACTWRDRRQRHHTLWQIIRSPQKVTRGVRRLQWLLGGITIIIAAISLTFSYLWAESGDAPGLIFIGLFVAAMPFACWVLVSAWQLTLKQQA